MPCSTINSVLLLGCIGGSVLAGKTSCLASAPDYPPTASTEALLAVYGSANRMQKLFVSFQDVDVGQTKHQCVFLRCSRERALLRAHMAAAKAFEMHDAPDFRPHLSLVYSDIDQAHRCVHQKRCIALDCSF